MYGEPGGVEVPGTGTGLQVPPTKGAACLQTDLSTEAHRAIYGLFCSHARPKTGQDGQRRAKTGKDGPKTDQRRTKDGPRTAKNGKNGQERTRTDQERTKTDKDGQGRTRTLGATLRSRAWIIFLNYSQKRLKVE